MTGDKNRSTEKVFIVEDDASICAGLSDLLESAGLATQSFASAEQFLGRWTPDMTGCIVLDVRLPGISGLELQSKLLESKIVLPVVIMTAHGDVPMVRKALKAGAVEFLSKPFQDSELLEAVEQAFALDRVRREKQDRAQTIELRAQSLTERERQVMGLVTTGLTNKEIAERLFLSVVTVKLHRGQMMRKMQAESLADLVKMSELLSHQENPRNPQS
ncbi:MAG TPA: response regulator [Terracidiphilus sp.]|jgi:FixJ family two-component response regulator|nr:response regulator [Terracidiphilus sp.]